MAVAVPFINIGVHSKVTYHNFKPNKHSTFQFFSLYFIFTMDKNDERDLEMVRKLLLRTQGSQYPPIIPNTQNNPPNFTQSSQYPPQFPNPQSNQPNFNYPYYPHPQSIPNNPPYPFFPNPQSSPTIGNHEFSSMPPTYQYPTPPPTTTMGSINESEDPPFCTQDGLESIDLEQEGGSAPQVKKAREKFTVEEDKLLVQSYINVSEDSVKGNDQKARSFWKRVEVQYNKYLTKNTKSKTMDQLKHRYSRIQGPTSKFVGCYEHAVASWTSGSNDADIMERAHAIYLQDQGEKFNLEHVWRLVKDHPRWAQPPQTLKGYSSKRTKNSPSGSYTSTSNPPTPSSEEIPQSPIIPQSPMLDRPIGQKAAKRKGKSTKGASTSDCIRVEALNDFAREFFAMEFQKMELEKQKATEKMEMEKQKAAQKIEMEKHKMEMEKQRLKMELDLAKQKMDMEMKMENQKMEMEAERLRITELQILYKDTDGMTEVQKQAHEVICNRIRTKHGLTKE